MPPQHVFDANDDGYCTRCGLPEHNRFHVTADTLATRPTQVVPATAPAHEPSPVAPSRPVMGANLPDTSNLAALCMSWVSASSVKATVYRAIAFAGATGKTDAEIMAGPILNARDPNSVRPRRVELHREGVIAPLLDKDGQEVTRLTPSGNKATVWVLTEHARAAHEQAMRAAA